MCFSTGRVRANQSAFDLTLCAFIEGFSSDPDEGSARGLSKANNHNNPPSVFINQLQNFSQLKIWSNQTFLNIVQCVLNEDLWRRRPLDS